MRGSSSGPRRVRLTRPAGCVRYRAPPLRFKRVWRSQAGLGVDEWVAEEGKSRVDGVRARHGCDQHLPEGWRSDRTPEVRFHQGSNNSAPCTSATARDSPLRTPNARAPGQVAPRRPSNAELAAVVQHTPGELRLPGATWNSRQKQQPRFRRNRQLLIQRERLDMYPTRRTCEFTRAPGAVETDARRSLAGSNPPSISTSRCFATAVEPEEARNPPRVDRTVPDPPPERPEALAQIKAS